MALRLAFFFSIMPPSHQHHGLEMHNGPYDIDNTLQDFYFLDDHPTMPGWFKRMENIIHEWGMWPDNGLNAQCEGFKCIPGHVDCCCQCLLFSQSDFIAQKSQLKEYITLCGHICDFYPKFHCELNFIEQSWGAVITTQARRPQIWMQWKKNVIICLDAVPLLQIHWWVLLSYLSTCLQLILLQICKSVRPIYSCLYARLVWC